MYTACMKGNEQIVRQYLDQNTLLDDMKKYVSISPLVQACYINNATIAKMLLNAGVTVDHGLVADTQMNRRDVLHSACRSGSTELIKLLFTHGLAHTDLQLYGKEVVVFICRENEPNFETNVINVIHLLMDYGLTIDHLRDSLILCDACRCGYTKVVQLLIDLGFTLKDLRSNHNKAILNACEFNQLEIVKLLLSKGITVNDDIACSYHILWGASFRGNNDLINILLANGLTAEHLHMNKNMVLRNACSQGNLKLVQLLLKLDGFSVHDVRSNKCEGFIFACYWGHIDVVQYILSLKGFTLKDIRANKNDALHSAHMRGHTEIVQLLLDRGLSSDELYEGDGSAEVSRPLCTCSNSV